MTSDFTFSNEKSKEHFYMYMILGSYKTPKERQNTGSSQHGHVFGTANPEDPSSTVAFFLNWNKGDSITGMDRCVLWDALYRDNFTPKFSHWNISCA